MSSIVGSKRKRPSGAQKGVALPPKKSKRRVTYHSSSEEEEDEDAVALENQAETPKSLDELISSDDADEDDSGVVLPNLVKQEKFVKGQKNTDSSVALVEDEDDYSPRDEDEQAVSDAGSEESSQSSISGSQEDADGEINDTARKPRKRNDPTQFATSISKILSTKLTKDKRADPVLSRSKNAAEFSKGLADSRLEAKAKKKLREEKKAALNRDREEDVLGLDRANISAGAVAEEEKQLKRTAQRGVVKLFNAVRAAQVKGEEAARAAQAGGVVGADKRREQVNEMSKKGFLDLLVDGGS